MSKESVRFNNIVMQYPNTNFKAIDNVSFLIEANKVLCLIGENGAGKSSLMNILYGLFKPTEGEIFIKGEKKVFNSSNDAIKANIGMVHQHFMLVEDLSVFENIILGFEPNKRLFIDKDTAANRIKKIMVDNGLNIPLNTKIKDLPVGIQQKVEIVKILYRGADILIFDEPTAVLTPQETKELFINIRKLKDLGKTVIFITHKLYEVMEIADNIAIMRRGILIDYLDKKNASINKLSELMIGTKLPEIRKRKKLNLPTIAKLRNVTLKGNHNKFLLDNVNLNVNSGEIIGIAGISGNGQIPLAEAISGINQKYIGSIEVDERIIDGLSRKQRIEHGINYIPFDRKKEGLNMKWDINQNAFSGFHNLSKFLKSFGSLKYLNKNAILDNSNEIIEKFDIRTESAFTSISSLSGGNQQKVIIGRETIVNKPKLLIAAEPTRGVDIGAISFIHDYMLRLRNEGTAIILFSSDLDEIYNLADTILVMFEGKLVCKYSTSEISKEELGLYMSGSKKDEVIYD